MDDVIELHYKTLSEQFYIYHFPDAKKNNTEYFRTSVKSAIITIEEKLASTSETIYVNMPTGLIEDFINQDHTKLTEVLQILKKI